MSSCRATNANVRSVEMSDTEALDAISALADRVAEDLKFARANPGSVHTEQAIVRERELARRIAVAFDFVDLLNPVLTTNGR